MAGRFESIELYHVLVHHGCLPTFLLIGAMKAGTNTLYSYLRSHPAVFMPARKEPDYFVAEKNWGRGIAWYRSLFRGAEKMEAIGEASTSYTKHLAHPGVPERIRAAIPDIRLVYLVRSPIDRARSHYQHNVLGGSERRPVDQALLEDPRYLDVSSYHTQVRAYLDHFPAEQMLVVRTDELALDPEGLVRRVAAFIRVKGADQFDWSYRQEYESANRRADTRLLSALRKSSIGQVMDQRFPKSLRRRASTLLTRDIDSWSFSPSSPTVEELRRRLQPDLRAYATCPALAHVEPWGLLDVNV